MRNEIPEMDKPRGLRRGLVCGELERLAEKLEDRELMPAERAALRRMNPLVPGGEIFWRRITSTALKPAAEEALGFQSANRKLGLIVWGMAEASRGVERGQKLGSRSVGEALFSGGSRYSQSGQPLLPSKTFDALLSASGEAFERRLIGALKRLGSQSSVLVEWAELGWLVLNVGYDDAEADRCRLKIASDYYGSAYRNKKEGEN